MDAFPPYTFKRGAYCSTADAVKFQDFLPAEASVVEGTLELNVGKVSIGSHVKHSYVIVFNTGSVEVQLPVALVTYTSDTESNELTVSCNADAYQIVCVFW